MKQKEKKKEFRHSIRGYKKEDVNRYILSMDRTAKEDMLECRREFQSEKSAWETEKSELLKKLEEQDAEINALREENTSLKKANAESVRKQEEQFVAFAQLVADITELRKKLAEYEKNSTVPAQLSEEKCEEVPSSVHIPDISSAETPITAKPATVSKPKPSAPIRFSYSVGKNTPIFPFKKNKN